MGTDNTRQQGGGGSPGQYSWLGGSVPSTVDPKSIGTKLAGNLGVAIDKGPQPTIPSYNPFTPQTSGLINSGLQQVAANASSPVADYASGKYLTGSDDPYFNANLQTARDNTTRDVNSTFNSTGRFGSDIHAEGLANGLDSAESAARSAQLTDEWNKMIGAQGAQNANTATGLGYSNLLDSKNAEKIASDQAQQQAMDPWNFIAKNFGLLNGNSGQNSANTNQPTSLWNILGGVGSVLGSFL